MEASPGNGFTMLLLVLLGLAAAWYLGRRSVARRGDRHDPGRDYFIGLNYLLNEEPDDAIDTFIAALEINTNTLETHLALGTLLRRRGKVDKSIVVYQGLLERPGLGDNEINRIKLELTRSYITAGLLDRAEGLLEELQAAGPELRRGALAQAVNLYQLEKDWNKGVLSAEALLSITPLRERGRYQVIASHFHCELAEQEIAQRKFTAARQCLKKALQLSRTNVRASLLVAQLEIAEYNYRDAVKALMRVQQQDSDYESETIVPLMECYQRLETKKPLRKFIHNSLEGETPASVLLAIGQYIEGQSGRDQALAFLRERLRRKPSLKLMDRLMDMLGQEQGGELRSDLRSFHAILRDYLKSRAMYRCGNCGYEARSLHWLCPSCSEWGMIKPVKGVMGE